MFQYVWVRVGLIVHYLVIQLQMTPFLLCSQAQYYSQHTVEHTSLAPEYCRDQQKLIRLQSVSEALPGTGSEFSSGLALSKCRVEISC